MNVTCVECQSVYRVDPAKVTRENLRARCSVCGAIIAVGASVRWADAFSAVPSPTTPPRSAPRTVSSAAPSSFEALDILDDCLAEEARA